MRSPGGHILHADNGENPMGAAAGLVGAISSIGCAALGAYGTILSSQGVAAGDTFKTA